ncbi:diguanylate cyclase [Dokdonella sp.]|uniref:GGDEF domain-containing protein n=1 Tax=Dokdonella sp. TaxID=2291710 RepID=UPI003529BE28
MPLKNLQREDSFVLLRDTVRWRVALVLGTLITVMLPVLGMLNTHLGLNDTATLAWGSLAVSSASVLGLLLLPRRLGGTIFFFTIAALLVFVPAYGLQHGRNMQHWAYILPPLLVFLLRPGPALAAMIVYGVYVAWITALLLAPIEVVRFSAGYGLTVCFMYAYAMLQQQAGSLLRYHSSHDALSGCLNRRTFNQAVDSLVDGKGRHARCEFLLMDIDQFKSINDKHGHLVGDQVIAGVAATMMSVLDADTALFRYGGEEFSVMLVDREKGAGIKLAEQLRRAVEQADLDGVRVTISIGVAEWNPGTSRVRTVLQEADDALYAAKRAGRNRVIDASSSDTAVRQTV